MWNYTKNVLKVKKSNMAHHKVSPSSHIISLSTSITHLLPETLQFHGWHKVETEK